MSDFVTNHDIARFILKTTGKSYEQSYMDLIAPKVGKRPDIEKIGEFDYSSLIEDKYSSLGSSINQVAGFMSEQTGCSHEAAYLKLKMPKLSRPVENSLPPFMGNIF